MADMAHVAMAILTTLAFLFAFLCLCVYRTHENIMQCERELRQGRLRWTFTLQVDDMYSLLGRRAR